QLAEETVARGRVLILGGHVGSGETGVSRINGFRAGLTGATDAELIHVPAPWAYDEVSAFLQDAWPMAALAGAPPFDALFGLSDSIALAGRDFGRRVGFVGDKTRIVGFNGDPLAISSIVQGTMLATVETSPADLGIQLMDHAWQAAHGQPLPPHFRYKLRLVTAENAAAVAAEKLMSIATLPTRLVNVNRRQEQLRMVQLETSLEINHRAGSVLAGTELSRELANLIRAKFRYDDVQLFHWHEAEKSLVLERSDGAEPIVIPLAGSGALEQAIVRNQPIFIPDAHHSQRFAPDPYWPQTRTRVVLPIRLGGRLLGMLDLHSRTHKDHSLAELEGLQSLADQLGVALHNAQLYQGAVAAREEAELASQLKTRLLSNVSHEFRMPLNVILGYVQAALETPNPYGVDLPAPLVRDLEHVLQSGHHLVHLVNDLLDVSQAEIGALELYVEELDVIPFLANTFAGVANTATNRGAVDWRLQLPHTLPPLVADPVRMRQILFNLLDNARKFTARGHVAMGATADHAYLHLWVEDTGCGFPPALLDDLRSGDFPAPFSPDVRTGLGLGLTVVQYLVALHKGRVHITSEQGRGTIFHLYLPLCGPDTGTNVSALVASSVVDQDGAPDATPGTDGFLDAGLAHSLMR
ncbi:MAG: sensor histidine kinase, partial [Caldilineaceae bacterium]|nr:sensor histidine kinase [Caldilineaceae bacterium]